MKIIGYTYEADVHCPACTKARFDLPAIRHGFDLAAHNASKRHGWIDEHGLSIDLIDSEGNLIHPVFDISEDVQTLNHCRDCHEELV